MTDQPTTPTVDTDELRRCADQLQLTSGPRWYLLDDAADEIDALRARPVPAAPAEPGATEVERLRAVAHAAWHLLDDAGECEDSDDIVHLRLDNERLSSALDALEATGWDPHPDAAAALAASPAPADEVALLAILDAVAPPDDPMVQDEQGGCVWCGAMDGPFAAPSNPDDHGPDCGWAMVRRFVAGVTAAPPASAVAEERDEGGRCDASGTEVASDDRHRTTCPMCGRFVSLVGMRRTIIARHFRPEALR